MAAPQQTSDLAFVQPTPEDVAALSISSFAYPLPAHQLLVYHQLTCEFLQNREGLKRDVQGLEVAQKAPSGSTESLGPTEKLKPPSQESGCRNIGRRDFTLVPASGPENPYGAWTLRCRLMEETGVDTTSNVPLKGKRLVIKDNIPIRGMPMYCGTPFSFIPHADSPLITRCLAAGATIVGKAQCEFMCFSGASHTASAGVVRNPLASEYHAGGSSSGCAVLVASGDADLSIGCDQGGSIRIPSAANGVVGCKPTHALVPYSLIDGFYGPVDHVGPMTRTVEDNALFLGVLAGWDGSDERASTIARKMEKINYCSGLKAGVKGIRVGVVEEGFTVPKMEADMVAATRDTAKVLEELGARVEKVSVPLHRVARIIWQWYALGRIVEGIWTGNQELQGEDENGKLWRRGEFMREQLRSNGGRWSVSFRAAMLAGEWIRTHHPDTPQAVHVHLQCLIDCYASALSRYDVLLMPTIPHKPTQLPVHLSTTHDYEHASTELLIEHFETAFGFTANTLPTNMTGHPALSMPVGGGLLTEPTMIQGVVTSDNALTNGLVLPLSVMLVGNYFQEATLYQVAYALEQARPWRSSLYHEGHALSPT